TVFLVVACLSLLPSCATMVKPENLDRPDSHACLNVPEGLEAIELKGPFKIEWATRLAPGLYISEWQDEKGIYFRGPPGGVYIGKDSTRDGSPGVGTYMYYDGGIFVPHDSTQVPHIYTYFSVTSAEEVAQPPNLACDEITIVYEPHSEGVDTIKITIAGAVGGAAGGATARATHKNSNLSYGQAAGTGAVGGAIGMAIVGGLINMDIGKIVRHPVTSSDQFNLALKNLQQVMVSVERTGIKQ
ncbi:MAG: hypothetical protein MI867_22150, partial [Pseudomonadales bacterium]|nr:hypothetical protein [Pseudomonadales bacterium]